MSSLFLRTLRDDPAAAEVASHKLLVRAGYIRRAAPGIYSWLPLGLRVLRKVEDIVRQEMVAAGAQEVLFPALLPREPYEKSNRWTEYGPNLFRLKDRRDNDYLLAPTHEEMFTLLVKDLYSSYKDLPLTLFQLQTKYRDEARPRAGIIRGREFVMKDAYSFDIDDAGLDASYEAQRKAYQRIFERLGVEYVICEALSGPMGGSRSEEFLHPSPIGEDTFVRSAGGYAANVEAVTTVAPPAQDASNVPAPEVRRTPGATTIDSLVECSNERYPRSDRAWNAADMLKNVVFKRTMPDGESSLVMVGVPGDRDIDPARLEAALTPAQVEPASEDDLKDYPDLIPGYIGPEAARAAGIEFLTDPRIVEGSVWVSGANCADHHEYNLVMGRDFNSDGTIEAAEVRAGDPAPDGSGPLETARGIEIGHIFQLGRKYADALDLKVLDQNGKEVTVTMGSYGIGISRLMAAIAESNCDEMGLVWPAQVAPFHVHVMAAGKGEEISAVASSAAKELEAAGFDVLYDDRPRVSAGVKFKDAELLGIPFALVVGRGLKEGKVEIRVRASGEKEEIPASDAVARLSELVREALKSGA